jgi:hypothetical protein
MVVCRSEDRQKRWGVGNDGAEGNMKREGTVDHGAADFSRPIGRRRGALAWRVFSVIALGFLYVVLNVSPALGTASIVVTSTSDNSFGVQCTLRAAINNANSGTDTSGGLCAPGDPTGTNTTITFYYSVAGVTPASTLTSHNLQRDHYEHASERGSGIYKRP